MRERATGSAGVLRAAADGRSGSSLDDDALRPRRRPIGRRRTATARSSSSYSMTPSE